MCVWLPLEDGFNFIPKQQNKETGQAWASEIPVLIGAPQVTWMNEANKLGQVESGKLQSTYAF